MENVVKTVTRKQTRQRKIIIQVYSSIRFNKVPAL